MEICQASPKVEDLGALSLKERVRRKRRPATLENVRNAWEAKIVPSFRDRHAVEVEHDEAQDAAEEWADEFGPHAALKAVREAAYGWRLAMQRGWILRTPWDGVYVSGAIRGEQRWMPARARRVLRSYLEPVGIRGVRSRFQRVTCLALLFLAEVPAGRVSESAALQWSGVDLNGRLVRWERHKGVGVKCAVLSEYAVEILAAAREAVGHPTWVFAARGGKPVHELCRSMVRICEHIGVGHYTPHDLRRGIAQEALDGGATLEDVSALLGHESVKTTETYLRWSSARARRAQDIVTLGGVR